MDPEVAFELLSNTLQDKGLGDVVVQVKSTIEAGKITTKKLSTFKLIDEVEFEPPRFIEVSNIERFKPTKKKAAFGVVEDYGEAEKLELLLQAIRRITVSTENIRDEILDILGDEIGSVEIIRSPDEESLKIKQLGVVGDTTDRRKLERI